MISNENSNSNNLDKTSEIGSLNELFKEINKTLNDESLNNNILNNSEKQKSEENSKKLNNTEKKI